MRDLRLIGVHDDGEHLVVTDDASGEEFRLRIDEPLRAAARRDRPRLGQLQIAIDNDVRPREVQAMIRAGATADEVSARTGWDLDKIARFEGPVLAEREHVAERAQTVRLRGTNQAGAPETLAQRAATRLKGRGVEPASVEWDARRDTDGQWTVSAVFTAGGRERTATWWFDMAGMSVVAKNDEAKWLSEADAPAGPVPAAVHRPTAVFDVEVEENRAERAQRANTDDLIASMREHSGAKGRRRGGRKRGRATDAAPAVTEDALPLETGDERPPAAKGPHPRDTTSTDPTPEDAVQESSAAEAPAEDAPTTPVADAPEQAAPQPTGAMAPAAPPEAPTSAPADTTPEEPSEPDTTQSAADVETAAADSPADDGDRSPDTADAPAGSEPAKDDSGGQGKPKGKGRGGRKGRASVPSWDDVMFGTSRD